MPAKPLWTPCYSHGGSAEPKWPVVASGAVNSGRPIVIISSSMNRENWPTLVIVLKAGTAHVVLEANGSPLDSNGNPETTEWVDVSNGGYELDAAADNKRAKRLSPMMPTYRTRITAQAGSDLVSYVPLIVLPSGQIASASHPGIMSQTPIG